MAKNQRLHQFVRELRAGPPIEKGRDVWAVQRALGKVKPKGQRKPLLVPGHYSPRQYDTATQRAVEHFNQSRGMTGAHYTLKSHKALGPFFDAYGDLLLAQAAASYHAQTDEDTIRAKIVATGFWYFNHRWEMRYSQARPIYTIYNHCFNPCVPPRLDCSGFDETCYAANGELHRLGYKNQGGYGNTWSIDEFGRRVSLAEAKPADLCFHYSDNHHMSLYVGKVNGTQAVLSFGSYPLRLLPVNYNNSLNHIKSYF